MDLHLVLLPMIVAASLASTERCVSSPGSTVDLALHSQRNASGHWIITVNTQRSTLTENLRELIVNVHQETRLCGSNEIEQLISMTTVYPPEHDTSVTGAFVSTAQSPATPSTRITAAPSTTATNNTPTTTTRSTPQSCPQPGYRLFPEFNCYRAFPSRDDLKTWSDAREQCKRDGGDLMVMDTERERENVFIPLCESVTPYYSHPWVGVYIPQGGDGWMTVKGETALSTWWQPGYPDKHADDKCARANTKGLLFNWNCPVELNFICEIPL